MLDLLFHWFSISTSKQYLSKLDYKFEVFVLFFFCVCVCIILYGVLQMLYFFNTDIGTVNLQKYKVHCHRAAVEIILRNQVRELYVVIKALVTVTKLVGILS